VKIAPNYNQPVVHVLDASRAVPVASNLISTEHKPKFAAQIREEYDRVRAQHGGQTAKLISIEAARANAPKLKFDNLIKPEFVGIRALSPEVTTLNTQHSARITLAELVPFIDWSPFFHTWELRGRYPAILNHEKHGDEARKLLPMRRCCWRKSFPKNCSSRAPFMACSRRTAPATTWNFTLMHRARKF
jgi:5-methyltetrahydrofolate--homocysteine methyltransferase